MTRAPGLRRTPALVATLALSLGSFVAAQPIVRPRPLRSTTSAAFLTDALSVTLDPARPFRSVPVRADAARDDIRLVDATSDDPAVVTIERTPRLLPGQTLAYLIIRPTGVGETALHIGSRTLRVAVAQRSDTPAVEAPAFGPSPDLIAPLAGAAVWGQVNVSASCWRLPGEPADRPPQLKLRIGEGSKTRTIEPIWWNKAEEGPLALASFAVNFSEFPAGPCTLQAIRIDSRSEEHSSEAITLQVVRPSDSDLSFGECEADYGLLPLNVMGPPRPPTNIASDDKASADKFFNNAGADPRFRYPLTVTPEQGPGWYQVMLTAAGDPATGALPSIGITIDEAQRPVTASAIAAPGWHRVPIGTPIKLDPGFHAIRCDYVNDFYARSGPYASDRNLRLDRIEIARVASSDPRSASSRRERRDNDKDAMSAMAAPETGGGDAMSMMGPAGASGASGAWPASARAATHPSLRIALDRPLDNQPIAAEIELKASVWSEDQKSTPPQVALLINGREVQRHRSDAPRFLIPPEHFRPGANTLQLVAYSDSGLTASTTPQHFTLPRELALPSSADHPRIARRFTVHDPVWAANLTTTLKDNQGGDQKKSAPIPLSSALAINLPDDLAGEFDLWIECRSNSRERRVHVQLENGDPADPELPPRTVASRDVPNWFDAHRFTQDSAAPIALTTGPKRLILVIPDKDNTWTPGKGDKNAVWLQAIRLIERTPLSAQGPHATLDYPAESQELFGADAVVATITCPNALDWAEPLIDGKPIAPNLTFNLRQQYGGVGRVLVPLPLRTVAPGEHRVSLRITDTRGHTIESPAHTVRILASTPSEPTAYDRAVMLLDRFAYGPDPRQLADLLAMGRRAYLESKLTSADDPSDDAAQDLAALRFTNPRSGYEVPRRAIQQAIATGNPARNRFTLWAENHFSTWVRKDEAWRKLDEHERFAALGVASFYDLLRASSTSPAMLRYLDQERSYGGRLNENYAREIMELHTLGVHGGYTQQDVTNLAHVLTGWTTARTALVASSAQSGIRNPQSEIGSTPDEDGLSEYFRYDPNLAANLAENPRDVVGFRFGDYPRQSRHDRVLIALELLASHPSTARFVCTKLCNHYVGVPETAASPQLIDDLASVFGRTGGDMRSVLLALSEHPVFWQSARAKRLAHPTDYAFRLARTSEALTGARDIGDYLASSGQGLFDRPTPDGYPELDTEAMDSNAILQRWKLASKADSAMADTIPGPIRWSNESISPTLRQTIIDLLAIRLTGRTLGDASNAQALALFDEVQPALPARPDDYARDPQIRTLATFIAQLPEANIR